MGGAANEDPVRHDLSRRLQREGRAQAALQFGDGARRQGDRQFGFHSAPHRARNIPGRPSRIVTIHRGVDIAKFSPDAVAPDTTGRRWRRLESSRPDGRDADHPAAGTADGVERPSRGDRRGRHPAKHSGVANWRMVFVGDPQGRDGYVSELAQLIAQHGLDGRVRDGGALRRHASRLRPRRIS